MYRGNTYGSLEGKTFRNSFNSFFISLGGSSEKFSITFLAIKTNIIDSSRTFFSNFL